MFQTPSVLLEQRCKRLLSVNVFFSIHQIKQKGSILNYSTTILHNRI